MSTVEAVIVPKFTVQFDHPRNDDIIIQSIPGCRVRSAIRGQKPIQTDDPNESRVPLDQARALASLPPIPGMCLEVDPANLDYVISDPLYDNDEVCDKILSYLVHVSPHSVDSIRGVAPLRGKLDKHRMKTLCRELYHMIYNLNWGSVIQGPKLDMQDIDELPGNYLLNPGSRVQNTQPMFEKDWEEWVDKLAMSGG